MINEHDIADFQEESPVLEMTTHGLEGSYCTTVWKEDEGLLLVAQETNRVDPEADDTIVLDRSTQHALYLILKNRFEN